MVISTNDISSNSSTNPSRRLLLVSCPRTASNLLTKILSIPDQPNVLANDAGGYFFYDAFMATAFSGCAEKPLAEWTEKERSDVQSVFQKCVDNLEEWSARAKSEGKFLFTKEHAFWFVNPAAFGNIINDTTTDVSTTEPLRLQFPAAYGEQTFSGSNHTILPDEYLRTWQLAFIIRHPALVFASLYRAMNKMSTGGLFDPKAVKATLVTNMTLRWTRLLCDWCSEQPDTEPVIIDANDVIHNPKAVIRFCELTGLDSSALKFKWDSKKPEEPAHAVGGEDTPEDEKAAHRAASGIMLSTLRESSGVVKSKAPDTVDIEAEAKKWKEEFGEEMGAMIEKAVWDAMPDYEYLLTKRVQA
ncbi:hypothetical protein ASPWEDRAFT_40764 [Aspergillus wentii DTO 134E9]|uniref:Sulfotransferase domain-containing protein n=1 Tax=Aspergillus wentii DTO 134E9 TaxID=1073089 RepID=A0A1L9RKW2_ASPWE|nr:uncharacterized protein ASPWEDRAFT_40764 [Aspergillus wentii DTO 134E9]KAI9924674.1 hypothetical protein MW887_006949 [Aspergillus wentii]OJJ35562.1 hypothetical protein ASPWEDRAFT_40764 [Aspergillus wentii DTO 134E9]